MVLKIIAHVQVQPPENQIRDPEKHTEKRNRYAHHDRRRHHVRPRRPVHVPHFHAHVVQELRQPPPSLRDLADRPRNSKRDSRTPCFFLAQFRRLCHRADRPWLPTPPEPPAVPANKILAGEEGFEPPLSVLETDGLPLNLLP